MGGCVNGEYEEWEWSVGVISVGLLLWVDVGVVVFVVFFVVGVVVEYVDFVVYVWV